MVCPKCGSDNVELSREANTITGATSGRGKINAKGKVSGISATSNNIRYKTVALCKDCGWSWRVKGEQEERDAQTLKGCGRGCLTLVAIFIIVVGLIILFG